MTYELYAIKDELANTFGNIMVMNPVTAQRSFRWMAKEMEESECDDKRIYKLGSYDGETGEITPIRPTLVYNLEETKKNGG